ncbi:hypothetical protein [Nostoc sp. NMS4]|uniref:hypothetical protein n=1 Tax=Nostoc sp. NMS4 TaxID=2815390 RepID=UPI0026014358|nr:hypothetical protein [Nostoc sp. NMS4]MBN3926871.1 hypothetical protein [Nostoc sp. NMS4]
MINLVQGAVFQGYIIDTVNNIEGRKLMKRDRLENSWAVIQDEAERNWHLLMKDVVDFSFRLQKAAVAAWETFNNPYSR